MLRRLIVVAGVMLAFLPAASASQDTYLEWFKPANAHIRTAASYLRTGNVDFAALALEELIESRMNENADSVLSNISVATIQTVEKALAQIDANEPRDARQTLLNLRQTLFVAHRNNNITVFDDCVWSLVRKGKALWYFRKNPPDLSDQSQVQKTKEATSNYLNQLNLCDEQAGSEIKADQTWQRLVTNARQSLERIPAEALDAKDKGLLYRFIIEIRSIDRLLYFRFG
ncbi:MAG: hypothetical protein GY742_06680 [Hyphomicrobiales bacterium]|nr:hypothetical protein [Hyphomicrobiales bacterium]